MTTYVTNETTRKYVLAKIANQKTPFRVEVKGGNKRTLSQNAYLWGVCYGTILEYGDLDGWRRKDLHEYFLGEHFGWETLEGFGRKRMRPINRSSTLNKQEFSDYVAFIQEKAAGGFVCNVSSH